MFSELDLKLSDISKCFSGVKMHQHGAIRDFDTDRLNGLYWLKALFYSSLVFIGATVIIEVTGLQ